MNHPLRIASTAMIFTLLIVNSGLILMQVSADKNNIEFNEGTSKGILLQNNPLDEASGLAASRKNQNVLWTHEDDWDPFIFAINVNGTILGKYQVGIDGYDVEDIAIGPGPNENTDYLYIGHIGDNDAARSTIHIRRVPEPKLDDDQPYNELNLTNYDSITLQYPDGAKDAETLMVDTNGDIYIVSKRLSLNKIYRAAYPQSTTETITLEFVTTLPEKPEFKWITAGDISPNGKWIVLRNDQSDDYASIWYRAPGTDLKHTFSKEHIVIDINDEPQGEAICYDSDSLGFYTVSEHAGYESVPIWYYQSSPLQTANQKNNSGFEWLLLLIIIIFIMFILLIIFIFTKNSELHNVVFGIVIIIAIGVYASTNLFEKEAIKTNTIEIPNIDSQETVLTVIYNSTSYNYSLSELQSSFQSVSGYGAKINQIGAITGLNKYTGVPVRLLIELFNDAPDNYYLIARASDYEHNFSKENVNGIVEIYNQTDESYFMGNCTMIIAYKTNNEFIDTADGGPLRIAFVDDNGSITHSYMWVSSVNRLLVISKENQTDNTSNIPPVVSITASTTYGNNPLKVDFFGDAYDPDGYINTWNWDFGDESYDTTKDSQHTYTKAGSYLASLTVTDNDGETSTKTIEITVSNVVENGYISPIGFFDPSNDWDNPSYAFDANLNTKAQCTKKGFWKWRWTGFLELMPTESLKCNKIRFCAWYNPRWCNEIDIDIFFNNKWNDIYQGKYDDKEWEIVEFPLTTVSKARIRFHIRQAFRGIDADLYEFEFYRKIRNHPPIADFEYTPSYPKREQNVNFEDTSNDPDGYINTWNWDFGDGSTSTLRNPSHTYTSISSYTISLTITDNEGTKSFISKQVSIGNQQPLADFSYTPQNPTTENTIYFSDTSIDHDGYISSWFWDFGDGNSSTNKNPTHQYSEIEVYQVRLTIKDNDGDSSEITRNIRINPAPKDWNLTLSGVSTMIVNREEFESWVDLYESCWSDGNHTWCGVPLWIIVAMVDDQEPGDHHFNDTLAQLGYTIKLTAGDGWITELNISLVAYNDEGYIVTNTIDGEVLPEYTPSGHPSWPLHLRGSDIFPPNNVGNIVAIEIILN